jgi:hypothetical protein
MDKFEEIGRRLDEEVTRLFQYIEEEVLSEIKTGPTCMFQSPPAGFAA